MLIGGLVTYQRGGGTTAHAVAFHPCRHGTNKTYVITNSQQATLCGTLLEYFIGEQPVAAKMRKLVCVFVPTEVARLREDTTEPPF